MNVNVTATLEQQDYLTKVSTQQHQLLVDEPLDKGGTDLAPTPAELLAASLASCTAITLKMYTKRKAWDVGVIDVEVTIEASEDKMTTYFQRRIRFSNTAISEDQMKRFQHIANACPVHKMLESSIAITTQFN